MTILSDLGSGGFGGTGVSGGRQGVDMLGFQGALNRCDLSWRIDNLI